MCSAGKGRGAQPDLALFLGQLEAKALSLCACPECMTCSFGLLSLKRNSDPCSVEQDHFEQVQRYKPTLSDDPFVL